MIPDTGKPAEPGAVGPGGTCEADVTLAVCQRLEQYLLERGHQVLLTHTGDLEDYDANDLWPRVQRAIDWGADCFVSIHCNGVENERVHGFETFSTRGPDDSDRLQACVHQSVIGAMPELLDRGKKEAGFAVMKGPFPSVLIELDFITNPVVEGRLTDPQFQERFAEAIGSGICTFFEE